MSTQEVELHKLSTVAKSYLEKNQGNVCLKIDVQGLELQVLKGALEILDSIVAIQLELSMVSLYEGELLYKDMISYLESLGYELYDLSPVICDPDSGRPLQMDGFFVRKDLEIYKLS